MPIDGTLSTRLKHIKCPFGEVPIEVGHRKHAIRVHHGFYVPLRNIAVKRAGLKQHIHIADTTHVPFCNATALSRKNAALEHGAHLFNLGDVP